MWKVATALLIVVAGIASGYFNKELAPEEKSLVNNLRAELTTTQVELNEAKAKDASLTGGLVKSLVAVRVEILETNAALLLQRINAVESRAPVEQVTQVSAVDPQLAAKLESEISAAREDLAVAQADALAYSGLVGARKAAAAATKEQTLAMLEQRYLVAKYGLNPPVAEPVHLPRLDLGPEIPPGNGPFGLEAGLSKELIEKMMGLTLVMSDDVQNLYMIDSLPKPHEAFDMYALVISPTVGLCKIRAIGRTMSTNSYGHQLKSAFSNLQASLASVYGTPKVLDVLMPGSTWQEPREWMMGLSEQDRSLMAEWEATTAAPLKSNVQRITMVARAKSADRGYLLAQYTFTNDASCVAEEEQRAVDSL